MKKLIKSICFSFLALMFAIGSFFLPLGKQDNKFASANSSTTNYSFIGSNIFMPWDYRASGIADPMTFWHSTAFIRFDLSSSSRILYYQVYKDNDLNSTMQYYSGSIDFTNNIYNSAFGVNVTLGGDLFYMRAIVPSSFNYNIYKVRIYSTIEAYDSYSNYCYNWISYYDTNDVELKFAFQIYDNPSYSRAFQDRTYFLLSSDQLSDNQYYNQGYNIGKSEGISIGENNGYSTGYGVGYDDGFAIGKREGVLESNDYSFFGLFSAIIDAPVIILTSLFNFNFLGVNLWSFFTSILTISLVIFVVRKFMAKG